MTDNYYKTLAAGIMKYFLLSIIDLSAYMPLRHRYRLFHFFSFLAFLAAKKKRLAVRNNLNLILGKKPSLQEILLVFKEYGSYWAELPSINNLWSNSTIQHIGDTFPPTEQFFLGLTFHLGNFELFGNEMHNKFQTDFAIVAERLNPPFLTDYFKRRRAVHHLKTLLHDDIKSILRVIRSGRAVGIVCDRMVGGKGVEVTLFGKKIMLPLNFAELANRMHVPIYVAFCVKENNMYKLYSYRLEPVQDFSIILTQITSILENAIRKYPYQWHVLSNISDHN